MPIFIQDDTLVRDPGQSIDVFDVKESKQMANRRTFNNRIIREAAVSTVKAHNSNSTSALRGVKQPSISRGVSIGRKEDRDALHINSSSKSHYNSTMKQSSNMTQHGSTKVSCMIRIIVFGMFATLIRTKSLNSICVFQISIIDHQAQQSLTSTNDQVLQRKMLSHTMKLTKNNANNCTPSLQTA